jgi:hypothetical protein
MHAVTEDYITYEEQVSGPKVVASKDASVPCHENVEHHRGNNPLHLRVPCPLRDVEKEMSVDGGFDEDHFDELEGLVKLQVAIGDLSAG